MLKKMMFVCLCGLLVVPTLWAQEQVIYTSHPDEVTIFLNGVAYVRDEVTVANNADVLITLPSNIYEDTLIVRENDIEVDQYTLTTQASGRTLQIGGGGNSDIRQLTLEYLASGIAWQPYYRMTLNPENNEQVKISYFASIRNDYFQLTDATVRLAAGSVDAYQAVTVDEEIAQNQLYAGYENSGFISPIATGNVTIQYTYDIGTLNTVAGDTIYHKLLEQDFPARRVLLWNASYDADVSVIYKVKNTSDLPFASGIVRNYQDGLFIGSDQVEFTPIDSEGSITVGTVQDMRVTRSESVTSINSTIFSTLNTQRDVTLTLSNYSATDVTLEVVDIFASDGQEFTYSSEPAVESGNVLRWNVTIKAGETVTITYQYKSPY